MGMVLFGALFPKIASTETRTLTVIDRPKIPPDTYGLLELFCVDAGCDCRRVMLNVHSQRTMEHLATINYGFDLDDDIRGPSWTSSTRRAKSPMRSSTWFERSSTETRPT
jgi:hypothetical protein